MIHAHRALSVWRRRNTSQWYMTKDEVLAWIAATISHSAAEQVRFSFDQSYLIHPLSNCGLVVVRFGLPTGLHCVYVSMSDLCFHSKVYHELQYQGEMIKFGTRIILSPVWLALIMAVVVSAAVVL